MQAVRTVDGVAPAPEPIRVLERWRVAWHGRRDAQHPAEPGQLHPYLESLRAQAEVGQRAVTEWLHSRIDPIDREAVQVLILLDQHRRDPMIAPEEAVTKPPVNEADPQPLSSIPHGYAKSGRPLRRGRPTGVGCVSRSRPNSGSVNWAAPGTT